MGVANLLKKVSIGSMKRFFAGLMVLILTSLSTPPAFAVTKTNYKMCKDKRIFKGVNERTFLGMKKNIDNYANNKYILYGKIDYFSNEIGGRAYFVGSGSKPLGIGVKVLHAYFLGNASVFTSIVEDDFFKANILIPNFRLDSPYDDEPLFLVCSITRLNI